MFITSKYAGYNRHGEQSAAGYFLILMQPKTDSTVFPSYRDECADCGKTRADHPEYSPVYQCETHGILARIAAQMKAKMEGEIFTPVFYVSTCPGCIRNEAERKARGCVTYLQKTTSHKIRAIVRYVRMRQMGPWMMGAARVHGESITLSGSYGSDGLPCSVADEVYQIGVELPDELYQAWNTGGGWNGAGSEAKTMRAWALKTFPRPKR